MTREDVEVHLRCEGFINGYTQWIAHGECSSNRGFNAMFDTSPSASTPLRDIGDLPSHSFGVPNHDLRISPEGRDEIPNPDAKRFYLLVEESRQELYPGCTGYSKLTFFIHLFHLKSLGKLSNKVFTMELDLIRKAFSVDLPESYYQAKKKIKEVGLGYDKYDACPNDCTLYWGEANAYKYCPTCRESRWETSKHDPTGEKIKVAIKVMWHFPLKPRLQRLFMSSKTASHMRWHAEERTNDGYMRHPADSPAWRCFDHKHPRFAMEPRNVRLELASDGFNPFGNMSLSHSIRPVVLIPYNLPPWMCMKKPYLMLSILIPGPTAPGNNIDIYLLEWWLHFHIQKSLNVTGPKWKLHKSSSLQALDIEVLKLDIVREENISLFFLI